MADFNLQKSLKILGYNKGLILNENLNTDKIPSWVKGNDFFGLFLPHLIIIGDSREQDNWIEKACAYYGIKYKRAEKDKHAHLENLKEGDYSFGLIFGEEIINYVGKVAYERKGSVSELYNNCTGYNKETQRSDRERIKKEFDRFNTKQYRKVVLMLEFGEKILDLIDMTFSYYAKNGELQIKSVGNTIYSTIMSWSQPNNKNFDIIQSNSHVTLFWIMLQDMFYFWRNDIKNLIQNKEKTEETLNDQGD